MRKNFLISGILCLLTLLQLSFPAYAAENNYATEERLTSETYTLADLAAARLSVYGFLPEEYQTPQDKTGLPISRVEAVQLLYEAFGETPAEECSFSDVPEQYREAVSWAYESGLIFGTGETTFGMRNISQSSFMEIVQRLLDKSGEETVLSLLGMNKDSFTLGDAALIVQEILTSSALQNNIPQKIKQIPFPYRVKLLANSKEEMDLMLKKAFEYLPKYVLVERGGAFPQDAFLEEFIRYRTIQYGIQTNCVTEDSWMYPYIYERKAITVKYQENFPDEERNNQIENDPIVKGLKDQFISGEMSSDEYYYRLDIEKAKWLGTHTTITFMPAYVQAWEMICDEDDVFTHYVDPFYSEIAKKFYEDHAKDLDGLSDYETILEVKKIIVDRASYGGMQNPLVHELPEFFISGRIVCDGYAKAFQYFMLKENIPCIFIAGSTIGKNGGTDHAWNKVQLDGKWYNMDICWADTGKTSRYDLKSDVYYASNSHWPVIFRSGITAAAESYRKAE